jgi:hypothetical protein
MFFSFPENARWSADLQAVEFGVGVGEYEGSSVFGARSSGALSTAQSRRNAALKPTISSEPALR